MHEYKEKINALPEKDKACFEEYEISECFMMNYDKFIWLCNHIDERLARIKKSPGGGSVRRVTLFYCRRADKALLLSFFDRKVAVLYNAGEKVEIRPDSHRARDLRTAKRKWLNALDKNHQCGTMAKQEKQMTELIEDIDKIQTTPMGIDRIKKNLSLNVDDVVSWCKKQIYKSSNIIRQGKNWYIHADGCIITVNAHSFTIITAHKKEQ